MAIGDALGKQTTYGAIIDMVRLRTQTFDDPMISDSLLLKEISLAVQKWAKALNGVTAPFFQKTVTNLALTGSANPYLVDLSGQNPFIDKLIRVVHKTAGGTRTFVKMLAPSEAEKIMSLTSLMANSIFGVHEGDSIKLYAGSAFTVTAATDNVEVQYYRQPIVGTPATQTVVANATWTAAADGVTISAFTNTLISHVGGTFTGKDNANNPFSRTIVSYVSSTSFVINAAVGVGAGTIGFITPLAAFSAAPTTGTYIDIPDSFTPTIVDEVTSKIKMYKSQNPALEVASLDREYKSIMTAYGMQKQDEQKG